MVGLQSYCGLAEVAVRCLCELLLALPHFNFHNNIIVILAPLMNSTAPKVSSVLPLPWRWRSPRDAFRVCALQVSSLCRDAFRKLFQQDNVGGASLAAVRVISGLTKSMSYNVHPEVKTWLLQVTGQVTW